MNEEEIERLRGVSIHRILGLQNEKRRYSIQCVFHKDRTPSLCIYPSGNGYHCFACGANGKNAIDFVMNLGYSFKDAVNELKSYV